MPLRLPLAPLGLLLAVALAAAPSPGAAQDQGADPSAASRISSEQAAGARVYRVYVHLVNPTADEARDHALRVAIERAFRLQPGATFDRFVADGAIAAVRQVEGVAAAEYRTYLAQPNGQVWVAILATRSGGPERPAPAFWSGDLGRHLTFHQSPDAQLKLVLNGGFGLFGDDNAWFGVPSAFRAASYAPKDPTLWPEAYLEPGLGGIARLWGTDAYLYGAVSYLLSSRLAPDVFREETAFHGGFEKGYLGVLWARKGSAERLDVSVGRRDFDLPGNFLVSPIPGSVNAAQRGASYLGARKAYRNTASAKYTTGPFSAQALYLYPDRLPQADDHSQYLGGRASWDDDRLLEVALTYLAVVRSDAKYALPGGATAPRVGLQTLSPRLVLTAPLGLAGLDLAAEYSHQWSSNLAMAARAWYAQASYRAEGLPWAPTLSLRYASFSGDDPDTATYEKYDPLLSGKQDFWMQGMNFTKVQGNSNLNSWRVSLRGRPSPTTQLILDWYHFSADSLNNLGTSMPPAAQLTDRALAQEVMATASWFATPNLYTSLVGSWTTPLAGLDAALGPEASPWLTVQLAAYFFF